jgi:PAS domain S-box-containing protein
LVAAGSLISLLVERLHHTRLQAMASEQLQSVSLASIGDAVITTDTSGRITFLNAEAERLTGWPRAEAVGRPLSSVFQIVNAQTHAPVEDPATEVLRSGEIAGLGNHTLLITRDGREVPIDDSGAPIQASNGALHGVVLVFGDATERDQAETALRTSERKLSTLFELLPVGVSILLLSPDHRWLHSVASHSPDPARAALVHSLLPEEPEPADAGWGGAVVHSGQALVLSNISFDELQANLNPRYFPYLEDASQFSMVVVPLRAWPGTRHTVDRARTPTPRTTSASWWFAYIIFQCPSTT